MNISFSGQFTTGAANQSFKSIFSFKKAKEFDAAFAGC